MINLQMDIYPYIAWVMFRENASFKKLGLRPYYFFLENVEDYNEISRN